MPNGTIPDFSSWRMKWISFSMAMQNTNLEQIEKSVI